MALEHASRIRKREPANYRAQMISGNVYLARKEYDKAINTFKKASLLNPNETNLPYYTTTTVLLSGDTGSALRQYELLLQKNRQLTDALVQYAHTLTKQKQNTQAIQFLQKTISNEPYSYIILGHTYLSADNKKEAKQAFKQALSAKQNLKPASLQLFELEAKDPKELENILRSAISKDSSSHEALTKLANLYCMQNTPEKAISLLEEAVSKHPKSPHLANNLAWLYVEHQPEDIDEAMRLAQIANEGLPGNAAVIDTLGWIYFKKNMIMRAKWLLEEARNLAPNNPTIKSHFQHIITSLNDAQ